jgi:polysaccharide biosynthesis/export protein
VVGREDVLTITVLNQAGLSGPFSVSSQGEITFPLIGLVKVAGLTLTEVESALRKRLADGIFADPQVSVVVNEYRSQEVFVVGEVRQPGSYPINGELTLIEALARAGSTNAGAGDEVVIVRPQERRAGAGPVLPEQAAPADVLRVNLKELQGGAIGQNVVLRDGDTIFVAPAESVYVFGQVRNPGAYPINKDMTVLQALSVAGGISERGAIGRVKVIRLVDGKKKELKAELGDPVQPNDTVVVPERYF